MIDQDGVILNSLPFVRSAYNYDMSTVSRETGLSCPEPTKAQQQFKDECDINVILQRFGVTGHLPITTVQPMTGDFTGVEDYQTALESVRAAQKNFMSLPSKVRERFDGNAQVFVDFCLNPANIDEVRKLGLAPRPPAPTLKEIVNEPAK